MHAKTLTSIAAAHAAAAVLRGAKGLLLLLLHIHRELVLEPGDGLADVLLKKVVVLGAQCLDGLEVVRDPFDDLCLIVFDTSGLIDDGVSFATLEPLVLAQCIVFLADLLPGYFSIVFEAIEQLLHVTALDAASA